MDEVARRARARGPQPSRPNAPTDPVAVADDGGQAATWAPPEPHSPPGPPLDVDGSFALTPIDPAGPPVNQTIRLEDGRTLVIHPDGTHVFTGGPSPAPHAEPEAPPPPTPSEPPPAPPNPNARRIEFPGQGTAIQQPDGRFLFEPTPGAPFATVIEDLTSATPGTLLNQTANFDANDSWIFIPAPSPPATPVPSPEPPASVASTPFRGLLPTLATLATVAIVGVGIATMGTGPGSQFDLGAASSPTVVDTALPGGTTPSVTTTGPAITVTPTPTDAATTPLDTTPLATTPPSTAAVDTDGADRSIALVREIVERCYSDYSSANSVAPDALTITAVAGNRYDATLQTLVTGPNDYFTVTITAPGLGASGEWVVNPDTGHNIIVLDEQQGSLRGPLAYAMQMCPSPHLSQVPQPDGDDPFP